MIGIDVSLEPSRIATERRLGSNAASAGGLVNIVHLQFVCSFERELLRILFEHPSGGKIFHATVQAQRVIEDDEAPHACLLGRVVTPSGLIGTLDGCNRRAASLLERTP